MEIKADRAILAEMQIPDRQENAAKLDTKVTQVQPESR